MKISNSILYGGDYNPDQWLDHPDILKEDIRLMKQANINVVTLGVFSWAKLEIEEGKYTFEWLDDIIDNLYKNGIQVILATPSGARPHWLADQYKEVLRVNERRERQLFGQRHNHCYTSKIYREKVANINTKLAERYKDHKAVIMWHISNEYGGDCHCELCQNAFRKWLMEKYGSIQEVNKSWNTSFWSHDYQSFEQIESPSSIGEGSINGLNLDWHRFVTDQTVDFCREEIKAIRKAAALQPVTTNLMYHFPDINYHELAKELDVVSWDSYPEWHSGDDYRVAMETGMFHDVIRTLKGKPFLLMESCPGATNWQAVSKLKRPGLLEAASLQAVAHGSNSVQFFQIRKGRGGCEKFHGAVIDHYGKEDDRTYQECKSLGKVLKDISILTDTTVEAKVAIIYDWENRWAMENAAGPRNAGLYYQKALEKSYMAIRSQGVNVDMIDMTQDLSKYKLVIAPMLYLFRAGIEKKMRSFVEAGGQLVMTYWSGVVEEHDLCFLGGTPGNMMDVVGLRSTEIDGLYDGEKNSLISLTNGKQYSCEHLCQLVQLDTAKAIFVYGEDFYKDTPAMTVNSYGKGKAYYICTDAEEEFYRDVYEEILKEMHIAGPLSLSIPIGVEVSSRKSQDAEYIFITNFNSQEVAFSMEHPGLEVIFGNIKEKLQPYESVILKITLLD